MAVIGVFVCAGFCSYHVSQRQWATAVWCGFMTLLCLANVVRA